MDLINLFNIMGINLENLDENLINEIVFLFSNMKKEKDETKLDHSNEEFIDINNKKDEEQLKFIFNNNFSEEICNTKSNKNTEPDNKGIYYT